MTKSRGIDMKRGVASKKEWARRTSKFSYQAGMIIKTYLPLIVKAQKIDLNTITAVAFENLVIRLSLARDGGASLDSIELATLRKVLKRWDMEDWTKLELEDEKE